LLGSDIHRFNLNTLRLDKELEASKIDLLLLPGEIQKRAVVCASWHTAMDRQVCPLCSSLQGEIIPVDSPEWGRIFPPVHLGCFLSSKIPILTSRGDKEIGDIVVGDRVLTHNGRFRRVLRLFRQEDYQGLVIELTVAGIDRFIVTREHPFLTKDGWKTAVELDKDGLIMSQLTVAYQGSYIFEPLVIRSVAKIRLNEPKTLYNFAVEEDESYIAMGLVSHNCRCMLSYITADERGVVQRLERYKPIDPDLLAKWSSKIYTDAEIREMAKTFKEVKPVTYEGTVDSESERILRAGLRTKTEHGAAIDAKGKVIMKRAGKSPDIVTLTPDDLEKMRVGKAKGFIHNHPGGASFSAGDVDFANKLNLDEMMAVGKKYRYVIKPKPGGRWPTADLDELTKMWNSARDATQAKYNAIYRKSPATIDWEDLYRQQTHEMWEGMSKKLGLVYKRSTW